MPRLPRPHGPVVNSVQRGWGEVEIELVSDASISSFRATLTTIVVKLKLELRGEVVERSRPPRHRSRGRRLGCNEGTENDCGLAATLG
jgi:hypothetical protein